jgi:DNA-binding beta-propeller fold protein YncE
MRILVLALLIVVSTSRAHASSSGYVYVAMRAAACAQPTPCAPPQVLVFDGATAQIVTSIDLPVHTAPAGIAMSPDGAHLYVSTVGVEFGASTSLTVIDARRHTWLATHPLAAHQFGELAVRHDDSRVYVMGRSAGNSFDHEVQAFDTSTHAIVATVVKSGVSSGAIAYSRATDRVYVLMDGGFGSSLTAYTADTLTTVGSVSYNQGSHTALGVSADGTRLFVNVYTPWPNPSTGSHTMRVVDPSSLATVTLAGAGYDLLDTDPVETLPSGDVLFARRSLSTPEISTLHRFTPDSGAHAAPVPLRGFITGLASPAAFRRAFVLTVPTEPSSTEPGTLFSIDLPTGTVVSERPLPPARYITSTPPAAASCNYRVDSAFASMNRDGEGLPGTPGPGVAIALATDCAWTASAAASWVHLSVASGTGTATIRITADAHSGPMRRAQVVIGGQIVTVTQAGTDSQPPFGFFDTPSDNAIVSGTIPVTGWAIDDVAVTGVEIYRDPLPGEPQFQIKLGDATFVNGARPDVDAAHPGVPFGSRAGWGYQLLTNMLPGGDRTFRLYAWARDLDGHATLLATRAITVRNATATEPFGAIDTPGQGETVSGAIINWGWALTPQPASIPTDGSTIDVVIDGLVVGHPTFGLDRPDIAALFPGYANSNSAVGYFTIDTTTLANGLHTIAWVVRDSLGRAQGIGSRYFTVQNP